MRISLEELITITGENTPKKQADWFEAHFDVKAVYDSNGVIITPDVFNALVAKAYGVSIKDNAESSRPQLISPKVKQNVNNDLNYDEILKLIKSTHPRPVHVNLRQAAEMLNVSEPTARKLLRSGKIKLNDAGLIPITEIDKFALPADPRK